MAKVNLKDATKGLVEEASGILGKATGIRKDADALFAAVRQAKAFVDAGVSEDINRNIEYMKLRAEA